jgi:octopine/nopaline transport system permease protein
MSRWLMFRRIIAPQVLRFAIPGLGNLWQVALKDSSLISVTGLAELMRESQVAAGSTRQPFVFYLAGGALYLLLTVFSNRVFDVAEARATRGLRRAHG